MAKNENFVNNDKGTKKIKKPTTWKDAILHVCIILAVGVAYFFSPIDIIPDPATAAYGAGMYDDAAIGLASVIGAIVSIIVDVKKIKNGK